MFDMQVRKLKSTYRTQTDRRNQALYFTTRGSDVKGSQVFGGAEDRSTLMATCGVGYLIAASLSAGFLRDIAALTKIISDGTKLQHPFQFKVGP